MISWRRSLGMSKCRTASKCPGGPAGSKPWRSRSIWFVPRKVRARVFRVVGRGEERPPAGLLDRRRVAVVVARYGAEAVCDHGGGVDRGNRPPEQVVVLGMKGGHQGIGADEVDHRR